ncbi:MAG: hypothetical protein M0R68_15715 [Bacteroidetes bacterium]|nr:hypothetical protein [Bacteroidota bacterium]
MTQLAKLKKPKRYKMPDDIDKATRRYITELEQYCFGLEFNLDLAKAKLYKKKQPRAQYQQEIKVCEQTS